MPFLIDFTIYQENKTNTNDMLESITQCPKHMRQLIFVMSNVHEMNTNYESEQVQQKNIHDIALHEKNSTS